MRLSRVRKFRNRKKKWFLTVKLAAIMYLFVFLGIYLTSETDAYYNDIETSKFSITAATCKDKGQHIKGCKQEKRIKEGQEPQDYPVKKTETNFEENSGSESSNEASDPKDGFKEQNSLLDDHPKKEEISELTKKETTTQQEEISSSESSQEDSQDQISE